MYGSIKQLPDLFFHLQKIITKNWKKESDSKENIAEYSYVHWKQITEKTNEIYWLLRLVNMLNIWWVHESVCVFQWLCILSPSISVCKWVCSEMLCSFACVAGYRLMCWVCYCGRTQVSIVKMFNPSLCTSKALSFFRFSI